MAVPPLFSLHFFQVLQGTSNFSLHFKIFWPQSQPSGYMELSQNFGTCNPFIFPPEFFFRRQSINSRQKNTCRVDFFGGAASFFFWDPQVYSLLPHLVRQLDTDGRCGFMARKCKEFAQLKGWLARKGKSNETHDGCMKKSKASQS